MKFRYFMLDGQGELQRASQVDVEGLWDGYRRAEDFGCAVGNEIRLASVLVDRRLLPQKIYLLRLPLTHGKFTQESYLTLRVFAKPDCFTPKEVIQHHTEGWPSDFFQQLAVALDVPMAQLNVPLGVGGPLFLAAAMRVTPQQALRYFH